MVRQAPGGNSSICLGTDGINTGPQVSNNVFASDANPNSGNFLTDRPSTRVVQKPGGSSTCPFATDENLTFNQARGSRRQPVGGKSTFRFGDDCTHLEEQKAASIAARKAEEEAAKAEMDMLKGMPARYAEDTQRAAGQYASQEMEPEMKRRVPPGGHSSIQFG